MSKSGQDITVARKERALMLLLQGAGITEIANNLGVSNVAVYQWKRDDKQFAERWAETLENLIDMASEELQANHQTVNGELLRIIKEGERERDRLDAIKLYYEVLGKRSRGADFNFTLEIGE